MAVDGARQHLGFHIAAKAHVILGTLGVGHADGVLFDDRAFIQIGGNVMGGGADEFDAPFTDNGIQFSNHDRHISAFKHNFDRVGREQEIDHRLPKIKNLWTNGQVERMNRTIKAASVNRCRCDDHNQLFTTPIASNWTANR